MDFDRKAFLAAVKTVEPALSNRELIPVLRNLWFDGDVVRATDGVIGIEAQCKTGPGFVGGLPGSVLIGFVESLDRDTFKAEIQDNVVTLICERSRIKLALEPAANAVWPFAAANAEPDIEVALDATWRQALDFALLSVTNNSEKEQRRGVTFSPSNNGQTLNLYSTDGGSISWAKLDAVDWTMAEFTATGDFVKETLRLMGDDSKLLLRETSIEAANEAGVRVFSKLPHIEEPEQFARILKRNLGEAELVPLPDGIKKTLERTELLKDNKDGIAAKLTFVDKDLLVIEAKSNYGDLKEELYLDPDGEGHPLVSAYFKAERLLHGLEGRDYFAVSERCVILSGPEHLTYLVSAYKAPK